MSLEQEWPQIHAILEQQMTLDVPSVRSDGHPHVTPTSSLCLRCDCTGYYKPIPTT
jgi:hypothetical protein